MPPVSRPHSTIFILKGLAHFEQGGRTFAPVFEGASPLGDQRRDGYLAPYIAVVDSFSMTTLSPHFRRYFRILRVLRVLLLLLLLLLTRFRRQSSRNDDCSKCFLLLSSLTLRRDQRQNNTPTVTNQSHYHHSLFSSPSHQSITLSSLSSRSLLPLSSRNDSGSEKIGQEWIEEDRSQQVKDDSKEDGDRKGRESLFPDCEEHDGAE